MVIKHVNNYTINLCNEVKNNIPVALAALAVGSNAATCLTRPAEADPKLTRLNRLYCTPLEGYIQCEMGSI